jgi:general secretion pathway protein B
MSYILDALKQNEAASHSNWVMQSDYQQEYLLNKKLSFYRNLALVLGFLLTLSLGFFIGKSMQSDKISTDKAVVNDVATSPASSNINTNVPSQPVMANNQNSNVQYQIVPVYAQPVLQANQTLTAPVNTPANVINTFPVNNTFASSNQPASQSTVEVTVPTTQPASDDLDTSNYNVVGYQQEQKAETNALIDAFSEAFEQAQNEPSEQTVVTSSTTSAVVRPIELLPDSFKARLPEINYQAHVFASEPSRSWIKINDRELRVGDNFNGVYIVEIAAEQLLLQYDYVEFSLGAMDDWRFN